MSNLQRSPEWLAAKLGKVGASRISDVIARTKSGWSTSRANYMAELVAERLTGVPTDSYVSPAMRWGIEQEPQARAAYEFYADATVAAAGFVDHPQITGAGASPDGLVGDEVLLPPQAVAAISKGAIIAAAEMRTTKPEQRGCRTRSRPSRQAACTRKRLCHVWMRSSTQPF